MLGVRDGSYDMYSLSVDGSDGWVTLGDNGVLTVAFPDTVIGSHLWLFVGEAGLVAQGSTELMNAAVEVIDVVPAPGAILLAGLGSILVGALRRRKVV
jgi:hypothetical protein